ncbi:MAG: DUF1559 domain-containing protein [Armatimonadota bacterium]|nr:DUF1559 domain-containing protein [Armatimonadota bacterium]
MILFAFLAAIMIPLFAQGRENARKSSCQSNLKLIALGVWQYLGDYDERYPLVWVVPNATGPNPPHGWADALVPYTKTPQVYQCPSETNSAATTPRQPGYTDYWFNANLNVKRGAKGPVIGFQLADQTNSAMTVLAGDGTQGTATYNTCGAGQSIGPGAVCNPVNAPSVNKCWLMVPVAQQHQEGSNYAFVDGHVKWRRGRNNQAAFTGFSNGAGGRGAASHNVTGCATFAP